MTKEQPAVNFEQEFEAILIRDNARKTLIIAWAGLFFWAFLLILDYLRYQEGRFGEPLYQWLAVSHWLLFLCIIPLIWIQRNLTAIKRSRYPYVHGPVLLCLLLTGLSLIMMAILSIEQRGSILPYGIFLIIVNAGLILPDSHRLVINIIAVGTILVGITVMEKATIPRMIFYAEALGIIVPLYFISSFQYRLRLSSFRNKRKLEEQNRTIQSANTELLMTALQAQMNPHFIFNTLNSIQHFLLDNDQESSLRYLSSFARLIRLIFQYSKQKWISLHEELTFLKLYIELEELRFEKKIKTTFQVDDKLTQLQKEVPIPPLLIQPLIENAFKHGLMHREGVGNLNVDFQLLPTALYCKIEDNGVGRERAQAYREWEENPNRATGLLVTEQRLQALNETYQLNQEEYNRLAITDLQDDTGQAIGTRVELWISRAMLRLVHHQKKAVR